MNRSLTRLGLFIIAFAIISCGDNKEKAADSGNGADTSTKAQSESQEEPKQEAAKAEDGPAIAEIKGEGYTAKIHKAIPFSPKDDVGGRMFTPKDGNQLVALDMSVRNTSDKPIEMGQVMLGTYFKDESGKRIDMSLDAVAGYTYSFPNPAHKANYDGLWTKMNPGDFYRTTVLGIEVPKGSRSYTISMPATDNLFDSDKKRVEAKFTID